MMETRWVGVWSVSFPKALNPEPNGVVMNHLVGTVRGW
jgi:hypothetical protein